MLNAILFGVAAMLLVGYIVRRRSRLRSDENV